MGISYNAQERVFRLDTPHSTYLIGIVDEDGFLGHIYYGKRIPDDNMHYLLRVCSGSYTPFREKGDQAGFLNDLPVNTPAAAWEISGNPACGWRQRKASRPAA